MKIRQFLQGGQSSLPAFIHYTPVVMSDTRASAAASASADKGSESSGDLTDKDLMTMLKSELDGLPNDRAYIISQLLDFYLDLSLGLGSTASIETRYLLALNLAKEAQFNLKQFDKAFDKILSNGGIGEVAIDEHGQVLCDLGKGNYLRVAMNLFIELKKAHPEIKAFTNQELLQLRKSDPNLVFDLNIVGMVQNGIGMEVVTKMINDAVRNLGSDELKREGYTQVELQQIKNGLEYLLQAQEQIAELGLDENTSVDGIYNLGVMSKDLATQAKLALSYLYSTLPKNAKALLDLKAAESGKSSGQEIIQDIINSRVSRVSTLDASRTNNPKTGKGKGSSTSTPYSGDDQSIMDKLKLSPVMMAQLGKTSRMPVRMQNGTKYQMTMNALVVPIVNTSGAPLGAGVTLLDVSSSLYAGALDFSQASMGGLVLDNSALDSIVVDSTNLYIMNLPYTMSPNGVMMPDLKWLKTIESVELTIREQGITDVQKINELYESAGLPVLMDDNGNLNTKNYCKFGVLNGKASSSTFLEGSDFDIMAREINDENLVKNYLNTVNKGRDKDSKIDFDDASWWDKLGLFWDSHDSLYEGTIYMPFRDDILNGALSSNLELTAQEASIIMGRNQLKERMAAVGGYHSGGMDL